MADEGTGGVADNDSSAGGGNVAGSGAGSGGSATGGNAGGGGAAKGGAGGSLMAGAGGTSSGGTGGMSNADPQSKFHLYLMIGQSNMEGTGVIAAEDVVAPPRVLKFTSNMQWIPGNEPTANGRIGRGVGETGVSIGRTFAIEMMAAETDPEVKIGLMNLAVSGSPIQSWMDPPPVLKAVLWHQGEANGSSDIALYLPQLIQNLRNEVKNPNLPVVIGEVGITTLTDPKNKALAKVAAEVPRVGLATCENLLFKEGLTGVHYDSPSYREYGRRYAAVLKKLIATMPP